MSVIHVSKAWKSKSPAGNRVVIYFSLGTKRYGYISSANMPTIWQYVGGAKVREHRRELKWRETRYIELREMIEEMIARNEVPFGEPPAI